MFTPLKAYSIGPGDKVGVIGIGGLGHLGVVSAVNPFLSDAASEALSNSPKLGGQRYGRSLAPDPSEKMPSTLR